MKSKKKGAPKGNKNALKHGIFSKFIAVIDDKQMMGMSRQNTNAELALARVRLADAIQREQKAADDETRLKWNIAVRHWTEIIAGMIHRNKENRESENMVFVSMLDAIRAANDKQGLQK